MIDGILTFSDPARPAGPAPGLYQLRLLERGLRARIAVLDARVDELLALHGPPSDDQVARVDVLCAAIAEARELLDDVRQEAAHRVRERRARRGRPRRWA